jgi:hypothetical protein
MKIIYPREVEEIVNYLYGYGSCPDDFAEIAERLDAGTMRRNSDGKYMLLETQDAFDNVKRFLETQLNYKVTREAITGDDSCVMYSDRSDIVVDVYSCSSIIVIHDLAPSLGSAYHECETLEDIRIAFIQINMIDEQVVEIAKKMYGDRYSINDLYDIAAHIAQGTIEVDDVGNYTPIELIGMSDIEQ